MPDRVDNRPPAPPPLSVLYFGIYSKGAEYPRNNNIIRGLRLAGARVEEAHCSLASSHRTRMGVAKSPLRALLFAGRLAASWLHLAFRFLSAPRTDVILVGHPGHFHVHLARLLRGLFRRRSLLALDVYIPLYNAVVEDRGLVAPGGPWARLLHRFERSCCRAADLCLIDTAEHVRYLVREFGLREERVLRVLVGATITGAFPDPPPPPPPPFTALYFGTYIPLHGVETILAAARLLQKEGSPIRFLLVGSGQLRPRMEERAREWGLANVVFRDWVPPGELAGIIRSCHASLGVFGTTEKAFRVIPSKVFDMCAAGVPFVTADTPAVREVFRPGEDSLLVPPGDAAALAAALKRLHAEPILAARVAAGALSAAHGPFSLASIGGTLMRDLGSRLPSPGKGV